MNHSDQVLMLNAESIQIATEYCPTEGNHGSVFNPEAPHALHWCITSFSSDCQGHSFIPTIVQDIVYQSVPFLGALKHDQNLVTHACEG